MRPRPVTGATCSCAAEVVGREQLELHLAQLASEVDDPVAGLFGPGSKMWEINREAVLFLGGGRAALLQLAHPYVSEAIAQHSSTRSDPFGRFRRTFAAVFAMVFGDQRTAFAAARIVHGVHRRIVGTFSADVGIHRAGDAYCANEQHALLWVHATLWETSIRVYESVVRPLSTLEKDQYYSETRRFARLFGISPKVLPPDWHAFERYNQQMWGSSHLAVSPAAREMGGFLFAPHIFGSQPLMRWAEIMTTVWMPAPVRLGFGLQDSSFRRRVSKASLAVLRRSRAFWPRRLRYVPPYIGALRRLAGDRRRDRIGETLTRFWIGRPIELGSVHTSRECGAGDPHSSAE